MINRNDWVDEFQKNISELIARSPAADIERNIRAFMTQTFSRLDLVTREEFDVQVELLQKALQRITALESRLDQLEGRSGVAVQSAAAQPPGAAAAERTSEAQERAAAERAAAERASAELAAAERATATPAGAPARPNKPGSGPDAA